jgi:monothiol glutaredoxin
MYAQRIFHSLFDIRSFAMSAMKEWISNEVSKNDVLLFMKGTPNFPQCGFSGQVVQILDYLDIDYKGVNVLENDELRNEIKDFSNWPTIPQLYVKGEFVGGRRANSRNTCNRMISPPNLPSRPNDFRPARLVVVGLSAY